MHTTRILALAAWLPVACGPPTDLDGHDPDATSSGSSGSTEDGADETGSAGGDVCQWQPQDLPGTFDPGPECIHLVSSDEVAPVTVRIFNDGNAVRYLTAPGSCVHSHFVLQDSASRTYPAVGCLPTCESALENECGCLGSCPLPDTIALFPGGSFDMEWEGWVVAPAEASAACAGECAGPCGLRVLPAAGAAELLVGLATTLDCGDECGCQPNTDGWCEVEAFPEEIEIAARSLPWPPTCPLVEVRL